MSDEADTEDSIDVSIEFNSGNTKSRIKKSPRVAKKVQEELKGRF